eukprot:TRINITY_DN5094_c0_g1_i2.p1 TRINITY_DN5094_c0_g1~~TRINITY_DN5094_c0_g1_i2.p1  ORF type:complete len:352 (+),score=73.68 TRINITY_DN5094_c0_g1_i2:64-1119(+)
METFLFQFQQIGKEEMKRTLKVSVVQFEHHPGDKEVNFTKIEAFVESAARDGVDVVVFPECCITGYWHLTKLKSRSELEALSEPVTADAPSTRRLLSLAKKHNMLIGAGLLERDTTDGTDRLFNSYVVAMPEGGFVVHRKINAFEHEFIQSGDRYTVFEWRGVTFAVLICYDNNIVENVRVCALMGAEVLLAPHQTGGCNSASPYGMKPIDQSLWRQRHESPEAAERLREEFMSSKGKGWLLRWLPSRAHDNGLFVLFSNGVGIDDDEVRTGGAMIIDCYGRTVAETNALDDAQVTAEIDLSLIPMSTGRRWLKARKPELYQILVTRTGIEQDTRIVRFTTTTTTTTSPPN